MFLGGDGSFKNRPKASSSELSEGYLKKIVGPFRTMKEQTA